VTRSVNGHGVDRFSLGKDGKLADCLGTLTAWYGRPCLAAGLFRPKAGELACARAGRRR
jgi:hypothetical protein